MTSAALGIILRTPPTGLRALTLDNVITDATRRAALEGDGLSVPGGFGVWPDATNRNINGNATTNTTGVTDNSSTTTRVTTGTVKFGSTAFEVVSGNAVANEGPSQAISGGAAATQYTVSGWAWLVSGAATVRATLQDNVSGKQGGTAVVLTATPQKVQVTATTGAGAVTFNSFMETTVQQAGTWRCGGWQVETGAVATSYIPTDGATAARSAGRVQVAMEGLVTAAQGWAAARIKTGFASNVAIGSDDAAVLSWGAAQTDWWLMYLRNSAATAPDQVAFYRQGGGAGGAQALQAISFAKGDDITVVFACDATQVKVSGGGSAFTAAAQTTASVSDSLADIGYDPTDNRRYLRSNLLWLVIGKGTLTDADAVKLNAFGSTVPTMNQLATLSAASKPTLLIPAKTADAVLLPAYWS